MPVVSARPPCRLLVDESIEGFDLVISTCSNRGGDTVLDIWTSESWDPNLLTFLDADDDGCGFGVGTDSRVQLNGSALVYGQYIWAALGAWSSDSQLDDVRLVFELPPPSPPPPSPPPPMPPPLSLPPPSLAPAASGPGSWANPIDIALGNGTMTYTSESIDVSRPRAASCLCPLGLAEQHRCRVQGRACVATGAVAQPHTLLHCPSPALLQTSSLLVNPFPQAAQCVHQRGESIVFRSALVCAP